MLEQHHQNLGGGIIMSPLFFPNEFSDFDFGSGVFGSGVLTVRLESTVEHAVTRFSTGFSLVLV